MVKRTRTAAPAVVTTTTTPPKRKKTARVRSRETPRRPTEREQRAAALTKALKQVTKNKAPTLFPRNPSLAQIRGKRTFTPVKEAPQLTKETRRAADAAVKSFNARVQVLQRGTTSGLADKVSSSSGRTLKTLEDFDAAPPQRSRRAGSPKPLSHDNKMFATLPTIRPNVLARRIAEPTRQRIQAAFQRKPLVSAPTLPRAIPPKLATAFETFLKQAAAPKRKRATPKRKRRTRKTS